jgi:hypothetical protein
VLTEQMAYLVERQRKNEELAMKMFKRDKKDLVPQVKDVITAGDFYDLADGAQIIFT